MAIASETETPVVFDESVYLTDAFEPFRQQEFPRPPEEWARIERDKKRLDSITLDVVEGALEAAIDEAEVAVERTARSTIIREQHDYRASINTVDCDNATHVSFGATADPIRTYYSLEEIRPGDIFIFNDVYEAHGVIQHLPDYCVVMPMFGDGALRGFAQIYGHTQDVGGRISGSWPVTSTSIFEEGIQVPPVRLYSRGELCEEVYRIILRNTRVPESVRGDIDSFVGACRIIERCFGELCERLGADLLEAAMYKLIDRSAETVRDVALPQIPNGEWMVEEFIDNDGIDLDKPVKQVVTFKKDPEKIILDWTGTDDQVKGPINFRATGRFLVKWLGGYVKQLAPGATINEGICRVMRSYNRPGTVMSPRHPAPVANRSQTNLRNTSAFCGVLAQALKGDVVADSNTLQMWGFYGELSDGSEFILREVFGAGSGARPYADGTDTVDMIPNAKNLPTEFVEQSFPVVVERTALNPDSGGPGRYRGGLGYLKDVRVLVDGFLLTCVDRTAFGCWGVSGGRAGMPGGSFVNPETPEVQVVQFSQEGVPVKAGDIIRVTTPGGGGFGDPLERPPEDVRLDVLRRLVSLESAEHDYGVRLVEARPGLTTTFAVDEVGTASLRESLRAARPPLKLIERGEYAERLKAEGRITFDEHIPPLAEIQGTTPAP